MAAIPLPGGRVTLVDDADVPLVDGLRLRYRLAGSGYVEFKWKGRTMTLHRHILGASTGEFVDHINGDGLDNRRSNLRICSHAENMQNRRIHKNNKSGFKGVYFDARRGSFRAQVRAFNRRYAVGSFSTPEAAHAAYLEKAKEVHAAFFGQPA